MFSAVREKLNNVAKDRAKKALLANIEKEIKGQVEKGKSLEETMSYIYKYKDTANVFIQMGIDRRKVQEMVLNQMNTKEETPKTEAEKEALEIAWKGKKLFLARSNPLLGANARRRLYNEYINSLSQSTFDHHVISIIQMLNFGSEQCHQYKTLNEHLEVTLQKYPRLREYSGALSEWIKKQREEVGVME